MKVSSFSCKVFLTTVSLLHQVSGALLLGSRLNLQYQSITRPVAYWCGTKDPGTVVLVRSLLLSSVCGESMFWLRHSVENLIISQHVTGHVFLLALVEHYKLPVL